MAAMIQIFTTLDKQFTCHLECWPKIKILQSPSLFLLRLSVPFFVAIQIVDNFLALLNISILTCLKC